MKTRSQIGARLATVAFTAMMLAVSASAQVRNSGASTITLNAVLTDSITVSLSSSAVNFTLTAGSNNAGPFNALTNTVPFGGGNAGLQLSSTPILGNNKSGTRTDNMNFNINLAPLPSLPAGVYTGTLTIQAQAI